MNGYVGRPPGTTTISLGSPWAPGYPNPAQQYMPPRTTIVGDGTDAPYQFELAKVYGYTPIMQGWIMGRPTEQAPGVSVTPLNGFGQAASDLEQKRTEEELKTLRWQRIVSGVIALAAVGGLVVSIAAYRRR